MRPKKQVISAEARSTARLPSRARPKAQEDAPAKILVLDIETFPLELYGWKIWEETFGLDQIKVEATMASFGAKWLGSPKLIYHAVGGRGPGKIRDDSVLLKPLWDLLNEAQIVVGQNIKAFDLRWINGRLIVNGYTPYSPVQVYDTFQEAKKLFRFTSNKLEWQAKYLTDTTKDKHKQFPGFEMWTECLKDNPKAWAEMRRYNLQDILATEKLYIKQRPWGHGVNLSTYDWAKTTGCRVCNSPNLEADGYETLRAGIYVRFRCNDCGAWSRGKQMMNDKETRQAKVA